MREIPLKQFLEWPNANYDNAQTRGNELLAINIVFLIFVTFAIMVRMYHRISKRNLGIDDLLLAIAYLFAVGTAAVVLLANKRYGWDRHIWDVQLMTIQSANIIAFIAKLTFVFASSFTRLSLNFQYYRLIRESDTMWYRWIMHFGLAFNLAILIILIFVGVFACQPVQKYWLFPDVIDGKCLDEGVITMAAGVLSCVADLLVTFLPAPVIFSLNMPLKDRIGVIVLLSGGVIVTIAGIFRTVFVYDGLIATYDESWYTYPLWICAALEVDIGVICACVPSIKACVWVPIRRWSGKVYSGITSSNREAKGTRTSTYHYHSRPELTSQDPIVERDEDSPDAYRLHSLEFGKGGGREERGRTEKGGSELPSVIRLPSDHAGDGKRLSRTGSDPSDSSDSSQFQINKETTVQVSYTNEGDASTNGRDYERATALPLGDHAHPDHSCRSPSAGPQQNNATPRSRWDKLSFSRGKKDGSRPLSSSPSPPLHQDQHNQS